MPPSEGPRGRPPSARLAAAGGELRQLNVRVPARLVAEAKKRAVDRDITLAEAIAEAIADWLDAEHGT